MRVIRKIKFNRKDHLVHIEWVVERGSSDLDEFSFKCKDEARPEFHAAMKRLAKHWSEILELDHHEDTQVSSVSFSHSNDVMGVTIYASRKLKESTGVLGCNTPHRIKKVCSESGTFFDKCDEGQFMSEGLSADCDALIAEAEAYIDGKRAQMAMFEDEDKEEEIVVEPSNEESSKVLSINGFNKAKLHSEGVLV